MKRFTFLTLLASFAAGLWVVFGDLGGVIDRTEAAGGVVITYNGVSLSGPVFEVAGMMPGDCVSRQIQVSNESNQGIRLGVYGRREIDEMLMSQVMRLRINGGSDVFVGTLENLLNRTRLNLVVLGVIDKNQSQNYNFEICFDEESDDRYKEKRVEFDLVFAQEAGQIPVPEECAGLQGVIKKVVTGTEGDDNLRGSTQSELIIGLGGNDRIDGGIGHDCIIGGEGNDRINGGIGNDVLVGGKGNDVIDGSLGVDKVNGGEGDDRLDGGLANDRLFGEQGNDQLRGGLGSDLLDGGDGQDRGEGGLGRDACVDVETKRSCEL